MSELHNVDSKNFYGTMNAGSVRFSNMTDVDKKIIKEKNCLLEGLEKYELTEEDKKTVFNLHRHIFGESQGFDYHKMFMALQTKKDGSYFELTKEYVEANPNGWSDILEDILIITDKVPGVVAGHPVADCPVVMMSDLKQGITAVGHCGAEMIDRKLPMMIADALVEGYGSKEEDIRILVGACAGPNWAYDCYPKWAKDDKVWKESIIDDHGVFKIDMRKALKKQFAERGLKNNDILFNLADTITDQRYYSNSASRHDPTKFGRHFEGMFYEEVDKQKINKKTR